MMILIYSTFGFNNYGGVPKTFLPLVIAEIVETVNSLWASSMCYKVTSLANSALALASESLIIASSYLTVTGILDLALAPSPFKDFFLSSTYISLILELAS